MRTIIFRGRHLSGQWYYGNLVVRELESPVPETPQAYRCVMIGDIEDGSEEDVEEETVGQFTNFLDADGKEIYEGDILHVPEDTFNAEMRCVVEWDRDGFIARSLRSGGSSSLSWAIKKDHATKHYVRQVKVIGNIHDNPELIKEK